MQHPFASQPLQNLNEPSGTINFGSIKEVDAILPGRLDDLYGPVVVLGGVGVQPISKGNNGYFDARRPKIPILHPDKI